MSVGLDAKHIPGDIVICSNFMGFDPVILSYVNNDQTTELMKYLDRKNDDVCIKLSFVKDLLDVCDRCDMRDMIAAFKTYTTHRFPLIAMINAGECKDISHGTINTSDLHKELSVFFDEQFAFPSNCGLSDIIEYTHDLNIAIHDIKKELDVYAETGDGEKLLIAHAKHKTASRYLCTALEDFDIEDHLAVFN